MLDELEERVFVGRERELRLFDAWLARGDPPILELSGPGGIGNSALLRAFQRRASAEGWSVRVLNARSVVATEEGLLQALGARSLAEVVTRLSTEQSLLLIDSFEQLRGLTRFLLDRLLPALHDRVRLVVATRDPLRQLWQDDHRWHTLVRSIQLRGFTWAECHRAPGWLCADPRPRQPAALNGECLPILPTSR